jgi:cobalt-zinc-cadmium efflux system protein
MGNHSHLSEKRQDSKARMLTALALICGYTVIEVIAAFLTHSLALFADAGHLFTDICALILGLVAIWFSAKPATAEKSYGYYRSEILAGFFNALTLCGISIFILSEAYQRLKNPPAIESIPVFLVALVGLGVNFASMRILKHGDSDSSINARAAYLEILGDFLVSIGVMASSLTIYFTHWYIVDPIVSGLIGLFILPRTWILLTECVNILMEGTPQHVDLSSLRQSMLGVEGVQEIHDIHVWTITSGLDSMSGHVLISPEASTGNVLEAVTKVCNEHGLHHTTIQIEQAACQTGVDVCVKN